MKRDLFIAAIKFALIAGAIVFAAWELSVRLVDALWTAAGMFDG